MPLEFVSYLTSADPIVIDQFEVQVTGRGQAILANINPAMSEPFITIDGSWQAALSAVVEGLSVEAGGIENAILFRRPHRSTFSRISVRDCSGVAVRIEGSVSSGHREGRRRRRRVRAVRDVLRHGRAGGVGTVFEPLLLVYDDLRAFEDNGTGTQVRGRRIGAEGAFIPQ